MFMMNRVTLLKDCEARMSAIIITKFHAGHETVFGKVEVNGREPPKES